MTVDRSTSVRAKWRWPTVAMLVTTALTGMAAASAAPGPEVGPPAPPAQVQPASAAPVLPALARERATPLGPAGSPGSSGASGASDAGAVAARGSAPAGGVLDMALPLAVVLAAILLVAWLTRWVMSKGNSFVTALGPGGRAPSGVIEVLGRYPVARGQMLVLVKLDRRVLLLGHTSPARGLRGGLAAAGGGFSTLCDIQDPEQVASILWKVQEGSGEGTAQRFSELLRGRDAESDAASGLTIESEEPVATAGARRGGFATGSPARSRADGAGDAQSGSDPWAGIGGAGRSRDAATDLRQRLERLRLTGRGSGERGSIA